jgi:hypothetical protein
MTYTKLSAKLALFTAVSALTHTALAQTAPVAGTGTFTGPERVEKTWVSPPAPTSLSQLPPLPPVL